MTLNIRLLVAIAALMGLLITALWPQTDLWISGLFYTQAEKFFFSQNTLSLFIHGMATTGAWIFTALCLVIMAGCFLFKKSFCFLSAKKWLLIVAAILLGPGLVANEILKDHWGRARPSQIIDFGGTKNFTPFYQPATQCHKNCSFIGGDASFGFSLTAFAFVAAGAWRRRLWWMGLGAGAIFGINRIMMGGHFLSDTLAAALIIIFINAALYATLFGKDALRKAISVSKQP